ncbi:MAG: phosphoglycerate kinase, partial [archaeon]|nr:phosphoglycerate kinase [archaeon]
MKLQTLKKARLKKGMRVLVRVDFNEPIVHGKIFDDFRIRQTLSTIFYLLKKGCTVILISHLGRPQGKKNQTMSLLPICRLFEKVLRRDVIFVKNPFLHNFSGDINRGKSVFLVENIRFWPEEEKNSREFAKKLASLGDFFVNDAFGVSHRNHASVCGISKYLPSAAGFLFEKEISALEKLLYHHRRPFFVLLGGAKASTKIDLVKKFLKESDGVLAGGAIGNTILEAQGFSIGRSISLKVTKRNLRNRIDISSKELFTLRDAVVTKKVTAHSGTAIRRIGSIGKGEYIADIGPETANLFIRKLKTAKTILWNGPLGVIEIDKFSDGTRKLVNAMRKIKAYKVTGGGETIAFLKKNRLFGVFDHVSTGGGAMLEFLAGKKLPG